jgi:CMP-N-acetylneuraminic acid synthetase
MTPYNICENKWVSNTKKQVKQHYNKNQTLYIFLTGLFLKYSCIAIITSFSSFFY